MGTRIKKRASNSAIDLQTRWQQTMQLNYGTPNLQLEHGKGLEVWDINGKKYLDFLGGIATNIMGHNNAKVVRAISDQSKKLSHISNFYAHAPGMELAEQLIQMTGSDEARVFFCNSGAEANEAALKLSRLTGRTGLVAAKGAFHGRTMGALSLTGQPAKRNPFKPLIRNIKHVDYGDIKALKRAVSKRTAMVILEPIMGEAGVVVPPSRYLKAAREICDSKGALLVIDAVQTGMGRTGSWFGYEDEGITPDVITIAKGIGGGLPLGAMIALGKCAQLLQPGMHGTTFGGNPISCSAALAVIEQIRAGNHLQLNKVKGALIRNLISPIVGVKEVRGKGLLIGIVLESNEAKNVAEKLQRRGFLTNPASENVIRIAPAFIVTEPQILKFVSAFNAVCEEVYHG